MNLKMLKLVAITVLFSSNSMAEIYNHGNHNDPEWLSDMIEEYDCGSVPLSTCVSGVAIERMTTQSCRDSVVDDTDLTGQPNQAGQYSVIPNNYSHRVTSLNPRVTWAESSATKPFVYKIEVQFRCRGYEHSYYVEGASFLCVGPSC